MQVGQSADRNRHARRTCRLGGAALEIDKAFVARASADPGQPAESRFRFAGACQTVACRQWQDNQCQVGVAAATVAKRLEIVEGLPRCAIRPNCRWWHQEGSAACAACAWVVHTPTRPAAVVPVHVDEPQVEIVRTRGLL